MSIASYLNLGKWQHFILTILFLLQRVAENLALACVSCSLRKGARQEIEDLETGETVFIFHPRRQEWREHFVWDGDRIVGLTATGRSTVQALGLNRPTMLAIRGEERLLGRHPPS